MAHSFTHLLCHITFSTEGRRPVIDPDLKSRLFPYMGGIIRWVHETWPDRAAFGWQTGYGAFSVSESNREEVERYIANQEAHHRRMTFQEEFIALLTRHGMEYDERYMWE